MGGALSMIKSEDTARAAVHANVAQTSFAAITVTKYALKIAVTTTVV